MVSADVEADKLISSQTTPTDALVGTIRQMVSVTVKFDFEESG